MYLRTRLESLSLSWYLSDLEILPATLNTLSTGAEVPGTTEYCIASLESVGKEALGLFSSVFSSKPHKVWLRAAQMLRPLIALSDRSAHNARNLIVLFI